MAARWLASFRFLLLLLLSCGAHWSPCSGQDMDKLRQALGRLAQVENFDEAPFPGDSLRGLLLEGVRSLPWRGLATGGCLEAWQRLQNVTDSHHIPVAYRMLDAMGKPGAGILDGNVYADGSFQECLGIDVAQYCTLPLNFTSASNSSLLVVRMGVCMPREGCSSQDLRAAIAELDKALRVTGVILQSPSHILCQAETHAPYSAGAIIMITISSAILLLSLIGTLFDLLLGLYRECYQGNTPTTVVQVRDTPLSQDTDLLERLPLLAHSRAPYRGGGALHAWDKYFDLLMAFSLYKTIGTILSTQQSPVAITSINGLRVISMFWIILGHCFVWPYGFGGIDNILWVLHNVLPRFTFQAIMYADVAVDSFFFLSGLLVAYLTLRHMTKKKHLKVFILYYVHRVVRLTPTYAFVLFCYWFLSVHLQTTPIANSMFEPGGVNYEACRLYWWTNLLYVNNLYPWSESRACMGWMWYIANDMQFFVVAPLMIVPLFLSVPVGLMSVAIFLFGSFAATGTISGYYGFEANVLSGDTANSTSPVVPPFQGVNQMDELYIKPYARIAPYLVGLVLGFVLYRRFRFLLQRWLNRVLHAFLWVLATLLCLAPLYGQYGTWHGLPFSRADNVLYFTFKRFSWSLGLALLVFVCHNGYGGVVNRFLSLKIWIPLSRLTFCAYLVHPIVLTAIFSADLTPLHYTDVTIAVYAVGAVVLSYGAACSVAVFVEFPVANLEAAVLRLLGVERRESARLVTLPETRE